MFNIVPRLASTDHQNPIIDKPIAQTPRSVSYPLIDITQTTNRLFHASFRPVSGPHGLATSTWYCWLRLNSAQPYVVDDDDVVVVVAEQ